MTVPERPDPVRWGAGGASVLLVVSLAIGATPASGAPAVSPKRVEVPADQILAHLWAKLTRSLQLASEELEPPLRPPTPVKVSWKPRRIWSGRLGAPLLDLVAANVNQDRRAELVALTTEELIVLQVDGATLRVLSRAKLPGAAPAIQPRAAIGVLAVGRSQKGALEVHARASNRARAVVFSVSPGGTKLARLREQDGFPLCRDVVAKLIPGRNYFGGASLIWQQSSAKPELPEHIFTARCHRGMVDPEGRAVRSFSAVDTSGQLTVVLRKTCRSTDAACKASPEQRLTARGVGTAFAVADIDNDGTSEIITASSRPPGDRDRVQVQTTGKQRSWYRRNFIGGIAALDAADIDGDGTLEVIAAVRLVGSERIDLWRLN